MRAGYKRVTNNFLGLMAAEAMGTKQATKVIVTRILSDWVSLRIAIEQGLGGKDGPLKERWMAQVGSRKLW